MGSADFRTLLRSVPLQRMLWESREALAIGITMMFFQQFSGINAVIFFQNSIFMEAGISWYNQAAAVTMIVQVTEDRLRVPYLSTIR